MCWFLNVKVESLKKTEPFRLSQQKHTVISITQSSQRGHYIMNDGHCLCSYFGNKSKSRDGIYLAILNLLEDKSVKKIDIIKYWSQLENKYTRKIISKEELKNLIINDGFEKEISYRILDDKKFKNYNIES